MKHTVRYFLISVYLIITSLILLTGCKQAEPDTPYTKEIKEWQQRRVDRLKQPNSWLSLTGLYWLEEGKNTFGTDKSNDLIFPKGTAPSFIGTVILNNGSVTTNINGDVAVLHDSVEVKDIEMIKDTEGAPTILQLGSLSWYIIKRDGDRYGIRLKDSESNLLKEFDGIETYPISEDWKIDATFETYVPPKDIIVPSVLGSSSEDKSPGALVFKVDDEEYRLDVLGSGSSFFIIFADKTNGEETYGAGRFMVVSAPDSTGKTYIDFNKAYNPPCAFTKYATCPLPPKENMLKVAITAGEKMFGGGHH